MQRQITHRPEVIFLDAVGTLFGVRGSVGEVYSDVARRHGVAVSPALLDQAFFQSFQAVGAPAFPEAEASELQAKEFSWWMTIATHTFKQVGAFHQFPDFGEFFAELYDHFATAKPWFVYPDVRPALQHWQQLGIPLGILSNFDSRLYAVLPALGLAHYFTSITISTEVGAAKPDARIFAIALQKHHCDPASAWHIGDSYKEDFQAAKATGLQSIWLNRQSA